MDSLLKLRLQFAADVDAGDSADGWHDQAPSSHVETWLLLPVSALAGSTSAIEGLWGVSQWMGAAYLGYNS